MRDPERPEVTDAIIQGIKNAQKDYKKAYESHIHNSRYAPEYLMKVYIFQSLLELKEKCGCTYGLSLEQPVLDIVRDLQPGMTSDVNNGHETSHAATRPA